MDDNKNTVAESEDKQSNISLEELENVSGGRGGLDKTVKTGTTDMPEELTNPN